MLRSVLKASLLTKFLSVFVPVFVLAVATGLYALADQHIKQASDELSARVGTNLGRISAQMTPSLVAQHPDLTLKMLGVLMTDRAVNCVDVHMSGEWQPALSQPKRLGCKVMEPEKTASMPAPLVEGMAVTVGFSQAEIRLLKAETNKLALYIAVSSILGALIIGGVAFRLSVNRPIASLMGAIRDMEAGHYRHAKYSGNDEVASLCRAFNSMQDCIDLERSRTKHALDDLRSVYDTTPAILFTMSCGGDIVSASEHCLAELRVAEENFIGSNLSDHLTEESRATLANIVLPQLSVKGGVDDVPLSLMRNNRETIQVLLSVVPDGRNSTSDSAHVCVMNDVTQLRQSEDELREMAITDALTGLPNRHGIAQLLEVVSGNRLNTNWAVLFIDLDNFKTVNDTLGHDAGDMVLAETARRIRGVVGDAGHPARMGGDEFTVVLDESKCTLGAEAIGRQLVAEICNPFELPGGTGHVGASIGIAFCRDAALATVDVIGLADQAMYLAKKSGKNRVVIYDENCASQTFGRANVIQNIANALEQNMFALHFQPIIDISTMKPYAIEALLRVRDPDIFSGNILDLIRAAEETGQMMALGSWIFEEAANEFSAIIEDGGETDLSISINLSPCQLAPEFIAQVVDKMDAMPALRGRVIFEITETSAIDDFDTVCGMLAQLRKAGIRIAVDDFGTGYSSLSYITRMPIDILKLDRQFVNELHYAGNQIGQHALVRSIVSLASDLGLELVAEGLEDNDVVSHFHHLGVRFGQGYVFSRPMPLNQTKDWLSAQLVKPAPKPVAREYEKLA